MNRRIGFVSNSSSCSFTCDVCGATVEGFDMSLYECDMFQCENGHVFCSGHAVNRDKPCIEQVFTDDGYRFTIIPTLDNVSDYSSVPSYYCPICNEEHNNNADLLFDTHEEAEEFFMQMMKSRGNNDKELGNQLFQQADDADGGSPL